MDSSKRKYNWSKHGSFEYSEKGKWADEGNIPEWFWGVHVRHVILFNHPNKLIKFQTRNQILELFRMLPNEMALEPISFWI